MQSENRYINLLRATELAKRKETPYVPFDKYELDMFTHITASEHLPQVQPETPEGWREYVRVSVKNSTDYNTFVEGIKYAMEDPSKLEVGIMSNPVNREFVVYIK